MYNMWIHRHIALMRFRQLHQMYCKIYNTISFSYFVLNKPFYITSPTNTGMEMCMCGNCLNPHCLYAAIRKQTDLQLPYSLSEFLCMNMKCNKETETSFYHLDCILSKCKISVVLLIWNPASQNTINQNREKKISCCLMCLKNYFNKKGKVCFYE